MKLQSRRFEDGQCQMIDALEIGNVGTVPEKLKQAHAIISAEREFTGLSRRSTDPGEETT